MYGGCWATEPTPRTTALATHGQETTAPSHQSRRSIRRQNQLAQKAKNAAPNVRATCTEDPMKSGGLASHAGPVKPHVRLNTNKMGPLIARPRTA